MAEFIGKLIGEIVRIRKAQVADIFKSAAFQPIDGVVLAVVYKFVQMIAADGKKVLQRIGPFEKLFSVAQVVPAISHTAIGYVFIIVCFVGV